MSEKLLVADDSPTIQKVVGITLANTDYDLVQAQSEEELMSLLESDDFDLVLLDFNLSEECDGYELCSKVRSVKNNAKIMIMLGTFDNVADDRLEELGVVEKVIKPFESSKFIQKIKEAIDTEVSSSHVGGGFDPNQETYDLGSSSLDENDDDDNEWTISGPTNDDSHDFQHQDLDDEPMPEGNFLEDSSNELAAEIQGWGMSVPGVIGGKGDDSLMPPSMSAGSFSKEGLSGASNENVTGEWDASALMEEAEDSDNGEYLPSDDDLGYPDLDESSGGPAPKLSSSLVSLDELAGGDEEEEDLDATDPQIVITKQEDNPELEREIDDELEPDEFWAADDSYEISHDEEEEGIKIDALEDAGGEDDILIEQHSPVEIGPKLEEDESHNPTVEALNELSHREQELREIGPKMEQATSGAGLDKSEIIAALKDEFRPLIKDLVREVLEEMGRETSEKVAWEIIPDLAENLIRAEVERLSKKVQEKHSLS